MITMRSHSFVLTPTSWFCILSCSWLLVTPTSKAFVVITNNNNHHYIAPSSSSSSSSCLLSLLEKTRTPSCCSSSSFQLLASKDGRYDANDDDDDDDDDDVAIAASDEDWRDFRAKLVMSENGGGSSSSSSTASKESPSSDSSSSSSSTSTTGPIIDDGDLDGIGAIFADSTTSSSTSTSSSTTSNALVDGMTPLDPSQWAYDSGKIIEQGAVILGGVEQDFGFGLRQQYFHKAAILVLDHEPSTFTKGIILNRPTNLYLQDDINDGMKWQLWFGGDVQGLTSDIPDIVCLHSLKNEQVTRASIPVMKDIQWTTFDNAKRLVNVGAAKPTDFWVFCGYAGWGPGQLMGELDRKSWYMVATDSKTLLKELATQGKKSDPREAGLDTWTLLMNMIGRGEMARKNSNGFDDLMLKEWALQNLLSTNAGGGADASSMTGLILSDQSSVAIGKDTLKDFIKRVSDATTASASTKSSSSSSSSKSKQKKVGQGTLLRASSQDRSPFLLNNQEMHKSVILIVGETDSITVGVILNRPASGGLGLQIKNASSGSTKTVTMPLRFGGHYAVQGTQQILWLHCNPKLRLGNVGTPLLQDGNDNNSIGGIWKCTLDDVVDAMQRGLATPYDFFAVSGVSVWTKSNIGNGGRPITTIMEKQRRDSGTGSVEGGIQCEVDAGNFEIVPKSQIASVWETLSKQEVLTHDNLLSTIEIANEAWEAACGVGSSTVTSNNKIGDKKNGNSINNNKNGKKSNDEKEDDYDDDDDSLVFKSKVKVANLSDDALKSWIAAFLLGEPTLK